MFDRHQRVEVELALRDTPVVMVHGPRQTGKSTLAKSIDYPYVTLDDFAPLGLAQQDPTAFLSAHGTPLIIDEVQRVPKLMLAIKSAVDKTRRPGMYLLTGSSNILTLPKVADSLAGRMEIIDLLPLSQAEIEGVSGNFVDELFTETPMPRTLPEDQSLPARIATGGFPEPVSRPSQARRDAWFGSYVRSILERDVRDIAQIDGLAQMPKLLARLASCSGQTLNITSLARDTGIAATTLTRYIDILKSVFLVQLVPAWSQNSSVQFAKAPRVYLVDTGLQTYLCQLQPAIHDFDRSRLGTFVAMELKKLIATSQVKPSLSHLRTVRQKEVEFVLEARDGRVIGIDFGARTDGLEFLRELSGNRFVRGIMLNHGTRVEPIAKDIWSMPISKLWS